MFRADWRRDIEVVQDRFYEWTLSNLHKTASIALLLVIIHVSQTEHLVNLGRQMRVESTVLVNVVLMMASEAIAVASQGAEGVVTGQGEVAVEANVVRHPVVDDTSASAVSVTDDGIAGNLVDWMTIVGVVLDWHSTHAGGNCWKIKSKFIPEKSV